MGLKNVKEEIVADAAQHAEAILDKARTEAQEIIEKAQQEIRDHQKETEGQARQVEEAIERKMLAAATFDAQRLMMNLKKELIEEVIKEAKEEIMAFTASQKKYLLTSLLAKAKEEIDVARVRLNKKEIGILKDVPDVPEFPANITGGLIAENKEGTIIVNLSVEELVESTKADRLIELSEVLFGPA